MSLLYDYTEIHIPDAAHLKCYMSTHLIMSILVFQKCQSWQGWGFIQAGVLLFQNQFWTGVVLLFEGGEVLFKSGIAFARIRYFSLKLGKGRFFALKFWALLINCAPNFKKVPSPLQLLFNRHMLCFYHVCIVQAKTFDMVD